MTIERPEPVYARVAAWLRQEIADGRPAPGAELPSEGDIAERLNVSLTTVKRAMGILLSEGLITSRAGRRAIVTERPPLILVSELIGSEDGFYTMLERAGQQSATVTTVERGPASSAAADWLSIPEGTEVSIRYRKMKAAGGPMLMLAWSYFPDWVIDAAPALADPRQHGMPTHLRDAFGDTYSEDWVIARRATDAEARDLEMEPGEPVMAIQGITRDMDERTLHYIYVVAAGDRLPRHYRY